MKILMHLLQQIKGFGNRFMLFPETNSTFWKNDVSPIYLKPNTAKGFKHWHQSCKLNNGNNIGAE